ncbi:flagellar assembly protein FliH [Clostridium sp. LBM24168]
MRSSYNKGIFKGDSINEYGKKEIFTEFTVKKKAEKDKEENQIEKSPIVESYENLGKAIIEDSNRKKEKIISEAYEKASTIENEAYKKGYAEGMEKGRQDGYKSAYEEGYRKNYDKAKKEGEIIRKNADEVLKKAVEEKDNYLRENEEKIKELILNSIENILKHEVKDKESLNDVVFESLKQMMGTKTFIIKSRQKYCNKFKKKVDTWKEQIPFKGDIFIIPDESIEDGSVVIERDNGKMVFSVDIACDKIKDIFKDDD